MQLIDSNSLADLGDAPVPPNGKLRIHLKFKSKISGIMEILFYICLLWMLVSYATETWHILDTIQLDYSNCGKLNIEQFIVVVFILNMCNTSVSNNLP